MELPEGVTPPPGLPGLPGAEQVSPKSYGIAVALSAAVGWVGLQHFYLGRWVEGFVDLGLTVGWITALIMGEVTIFLVLLLADIGHALVATILLLIGSLNDGQGRRVCYPGQQLNTTR